jgi:Zn-dependent protease
MRDQGIWSVSLGRWNGVQLRLHMFFLLFAALTLYQSWLEVHAVNSPGPLWVGPICLGILLGSVFVHELGHLLVANRLGASVDEVVLGPLGGLGPTPAPLEPQSELVATMAGPLTNLGVCLMAAFCLALQGDTNLLGLMWPFSPEAVLAGEPLIIGIKLTFWINWLLVLINLIPAYPFDGGRALRSMLVLTYPGMDQQRAVILVARVAKLTAIALLVVAWLVRNQNQTAIVQTWFSLVLLGIFVYFSARREEALANYAVSEDAFLGYDFSEGYTSLERSGPKCSTKPTTGPIVRWWKRRCEQRLQKRRELEAKEDGMVDEILSRLHEGGMQCLTSPERDLLRRVSARYRGRSR